MPDIYANAMPIAKIFFLSFLGLKIHSANLASCHFDKNCHFGLPFLQLSSRRSILRHPLSSGGFFIFFYFGTDFAENRGWYKHSKHQIK